jgi:hypothetical protein
MTAIEHLTQAHASRYGNPSEAAAWWERIAPIGKALAMRSGRPAFALYADDDMPDDESAAVWVRGFLRDNSDGWRLALEETK